jgi:hypothetical protein
MRKLWLALALLGCASSGGLRKQLDSMSGSPISSLYVQWGAPDRATDLGDGEKLLHWIRQSGNVWTTVGGPGWCEINVMTKRDTITTTSFHGTRCTK